MNGCEHKEVMDDGRCTDCGLQVILTGQVPVIRPAEPADEGDPGSE